MKKITFKLLLPAAIFAFSVVSTSLAAPLQTQVTAFTGAAASALSVGDAVESEKTVSTDVNSSMDLLINNAIGVRLLPETTARVELSPEGHPVLHVEKGNVLLNVLKLTDGAEFSVKTPTAIASVRGTQFWGRVLPSGPDASNTFAVREGSVEIQLLATGQRTLVHAGEAIDLSEGVRSLQVRPALEAELQAMIAADQIATSA